MSWNCGTSSVKLKMYQIQTDSYFLLCARLSMSDWMMFRVLALSDVCACIMVANWSQGRDSDDLSMQAYCICLKVHDLVLDNLINTLETLVACWLDALLQGEG